MARYRFENGTRVITFSRHIWWTFWYDLNTQQSAFIL